MKRRNLLVRNRVLACVVAAVCLSLPMLFFAACDDSSADSDVDNSAKAETATTSEKAPVTSEPAVASEPAVELPASDAAIGQPPETAPEPAYDLVVGDAATATGQVLLKNALGRDITGLTVKRVGDKKFGGVLKGSDLPFADTKVALLKYDIPAESAGGEYLCDIRLKFSDDSKIVLHSVDLGGPEEMTLKGENDVTFVAYTDADGKEASTYEAEKERQEKALKEKEEEEKAKQSTYKPPAQKKKKAADECVDDIVLR